MSWLSHLSKVQIGTVIKLNPA